MLEDWPGVWYLVANHPDQGACVSAQQLRQGDVVAKTYEIESILGSGPVGTTYLARIIEKDQLVALKLIDGPAADPGTLQSTIKAVSAVKHDGLVKVIRAGIWQNQTYIVMEYQKTHSLRQLMDSYAEQRKPFSLQEAGQIVVKLLDALDGLHSEGLVHLHVKPANVLVHTKTVGPGGGRAVHTPKVTSLGFAALIDPATFQTNLIETEDGRYIAPDAGASSRQVDIYAAGVIFYELLCGQTPMGSYLSPSRIREELPAKVDDIIELALSPHSEDRYPTARDMLNDIQRLFQDDSAKDVQPVNSGRRRMMMIGGVVVTLALVAGLFLLPNAEEQAINQDKELRATVVKASEKPSDEIIQQKLMQHPDMVWIPAGSFIHGRMHAEKSQNLGGEALAEIKVSKSYFIDRFEALGQQGALPRVKLTWEEARQSCEAAGKRLCTDLEWERACKGPESFIYSYGDAFNPEVCGTDIALDANKDMKSDFPSGKMSDCKSGYGVYDMSGGPREWTLTAGRTKDSHVIKGGKKGTQPDNTLRCGYSDEQSVTWADSTTTFRCCMDDGDAPTPTLMPASAP